MSEGVGAASGAAPAAAAAVTGGPGDAQGSQGKAAASSGSQPSQGSKAGGAQAKAPSPSQATGAAATLGKSQAPSQPAEPKSEAPDSKSEAEEEFEEVQLGSVKAKLQKEAAKAVKDLLKGFNTKAQENAAIRKALSAAQADPDKFFEMTGLNPDEYTEARLAKKLQQLSMTPEQRKLQELEQYKAQAEKERAEIQARQQQEQMTRAEQQADQQLRSELLKAWQSSGLPADSRFGAWMASTMMAAQAQGLDWTWEQCAARVKEDFSSHTRETLTKLEVAQLRELLGDDVLKKLREDDVRRVTGNHAAPRQSAPSQQRPDLQSASGQSTGGKRMLTEKEYRDFFQK